MCSRLFINKDLVIIVWLIDLSSIGPLETKGKYIWNKISKSSFYLSIYLWVYSLHHNVLPTLQSIPLMTNGPLYPITQDSSCYGQHTMPFMKTHLKVSCCRGWPFWLQASPCKPSSLGTYATHRPAYVIMMGFAHVLAPDIRPSQPSLWFSCDYCIARTHYITCISN